MLRLRTLGGLWIEAANGDRLPSPRPRRLGLLAIVAVAGPKGLSRNRVRSILWPDSADEAAGHALRQTLYALHQDLGARAVLAEADLRLDPETISSDLDDLRAAITRRDWIAAEQLYHGPLAAGFSLEDCPEFERWLDEERGGIGRQAAAALEALAQEAASAGDQRRSAHAWMRLTTVDPLNARFATSYMSALVAIGDRSGALAHAKRYAADVRRELDADPDPTVTRLTAELRKSASSAQADRLDHDVAVHSPPPQSSDRLAPQPTPRRSSPHRQVALAGLVVAVVAAGMAALAASRPDRPVTPVLAVGRLRDLAGEVGEAGVLSEVLTTSMARLVDIEVIANSRILELVESDDTSRSARTDAARRAGATEVIEGELVPTGSGQLRLNLRRIELKRGTVRGGYSVTGTDRLVLIDSATFLLAADLSVQPPTRALSEFTPNSPLALRLYEEGLRDYYSGDPAAAQTRFREAVAEDSTFAMAAYYLYRTGFVLDGRDLVLEAKALGLSARAPDRERLIIQAAIGMHQHDPATVVVAESLATRFPRDPEALVHAAEALGTHRLIGQREREMFEHAIAIDSAAGLSPRAPCRLCDALYTLATQLQFADSGAGAEATYRRWIRLVPGNPSPVTGLALLQFSHGRYEEGVRTLAGLDRSATGAGATGARFMGRLLTGRLDEADRDCAIALDQNDAAALSSSRWLCAIVWRNQGRYQDASALLAGRWPDGRELRARPPRDVVGEYVLDLEMGRPHAAMRTLEKVAPVRTSGPLAGRVSRELTWNLVRRGTAAVMAREIDIARRLADSAEVVGRGSLFGRDPLLHYFLRGLIAQAANDHETAVDLFRRSIFSWSYGYTRTNLELARSLLALGRAPEAIAPLQAALRGGWDGSNLYVTRTELHELSAQAFDAAGRRDSARAHYAVVERAWRRADPPFAARYQAARDFIARTGPRD